MAALASSRKSMSMLWFLMVVVAAVVPSTVQASGDWSIGRATFYGTDAWSIHKGSCGYGQLAEDIGTGWDVAALADAAHDYKGSCGRCKEVRCKHFNFKDGYGAFLDRSSVCYDEMASVVVMVTDTCPCRYPGNAYSNKRWCCGDMYHMDLSLWSMEKLADPKFGVIGVEWRDVSCNHRPVKPAAKPFGAARTDMPSMYQPRPGWNRWMDKRIAMFGVSAGKGAASAASAPASTA